MGKHFQKHLVFRGRCLKAKINTPRSKKSGKYLGTRTTGEGKEKRYFSDSLGKFGDKWKTNGREGRILARNKSAAQRKRIETDLNKQLKEKEIKGTHYEDLVQDYLSMWDVKNKLIDSIEKEGVKVSGMHGPKSNPAINDLNKTNAQMLKILSELGLKANGEGGDDDEF
jgi:P27 family predicted phage terminase small subunit